ncbi:glycosyltransferase [Desulfovibrio desulfuricans]|uniref:glycosyltransferase n=2 Tax=Bacteria TaxID=2 RepID=UPI001D082B25|nr:glycosyltransferase [Desulfovibrio desulfuricans]MCB6543274.1 glycosyltransferase [Desulfovibrio desulfuricans]MCB6554360.1 glycosyltransferase [Desulfovibrio desulfuricans]MCB6566213.1 glycosyltransferase [Desulfovibrio desulfuricans]MCB7347361.1 glycosyltransferase [Desulfovibrio desulfuricans]MCQ5217582.1 glycosyltransferase [Desulfovibrio desulfuricans]
MTYKSVPLSVVLPVYNAGIFLRPALESIQNQTYADFECLLCDASSDGSSNFLTDFCRQDPRFVLLREGKSSLGQTLARGVARASAKLVARMDADDIALPQRFAVQVDAMRRQPELILLGSAFQYVDKNGNLGRVATLPSWPSLAEALLWGCPFSHPSVMFRREAVLKAGNYRPFFPQAEDYDLWLRMLPQGRMDNLSEVLLQYRMHDHNAVSTQALGTRNFAVIAQMLYLIDSQLGAGAPHTEPTRDVASLVTRLGANASLHVFARMLSCSAHLIGDVAEDAEGAVWLKKMKSALPDTELEKALAIYHLRCCRRYVAKDVCRGLRHLATSCRYDLKTVIAMCCIFVKGMLQKNWANHEAISGNVRNAGD